MAQADLFTDLTQGTGVWKEALDNSVLSMRQLKEIQAEISEQQMNISENKRNMLKSDYKGANVMKRMVSSGAKIVKQTERVRNAKKSIADTESDLIAIQKKIYKARKLGKPGEDVVTSLKKQYNATQIQNQKAKIGLKQMRQTIPVLGKLSARGGVVGGIADSIIDGIGSIAGAIPIIGGIISGLITVGKTIVGLFLAPLKKAFAVFLEMQSAVGNLSADLGLTAIESKVLLGNIGDLTLSAMKFGGSMKDVVSIISQFSDVTGKNMMFNENQIGKIVELGLGTGLGVDAASEMAASFENMGISLEKTINLTDKARGLAARYNVNTTKVLKTYDGLVQSLTGIGFGKGLENLTKLAAKATAIRFDIVASTKAFADTFFDPEKAVEASARMQTLGGKFAANFGDPMQLAFESMNDPTALAEKFAATVSEIVKKDSKGNYFIPPEERKSLKIAAETLGQNYEDAVQTAVEQRKIADKMATLQKSGFNLMDIKEEDRPALANLMSLNEKGQYTIKNSAGVDTLLENMTDKNGLNAILDSRKKNDKAAISRLNMMERLENMINRFMMGFNNVFSKIFADLDFESFLTQLEGLGESLGKVIFPAIKNIFDNKGLIKQVMDDVITNITSIIGSIKAIIDGDTPFMDKLINGVGTLIKGVWQLVSPYLEATVAQLFIAIGKATGSETVENWGNKMMLDAASKNKVMDKMIDDTKKAQMVDKINKNKGDLSGGDMFDVITKMGTGAMLGAGVGLVGGLVAAFFSGGAGLAAIPSLMMGGATLGAGLEGGITYVQKRSANSNKPDYVPPETTYDKTGFKDGVIYKDGSYRKFAKGDMVQFIDQAAMEKYYNGITSNLKSPGSLNGSNKSDMIQSIYEKTNKNAMSNIGNSSKNGNLNTSSFKTDMDQFIEHKVFQEAMTTMFKSMDSGVSSGTSSVVKHEGSITLQTPDGRFITHDQFNGASDMFGARLKGISQADSGGFGNYRSGTHDPIQPMYA